MIECDKQIIKENIILWVYDICSEEDRYAKKIKKDKETC